MDRNVDWCMRFRGSVHGLEQHRAFVLVEELGSGINVVISSRVGSADYHDRQSTCGWGRWMIDTVIVDGWLEKMSIIFQPIVKQIDQLYHSNKLIGYGFARSYHLGKLRAVAMALRLL